MYVLRFILQFNAFGAELPTGAALYNWDRVRCSVTLTWCAYMCTQDYNILYNASTPDLRIVTEPSIEQKLDAILDLKDPVK